MNKMIFNYLKILKILLYFLNNFKHLLKNIMITFLAILVHQECTSIQQYWGVPCAAFTCWNVSVLDNIRTFLLYQCCPILESHLRTRSWLYSPIATLQQFWNTFISSVQYRCTLKCYQSHDFVAQFAK